MLDWLFDHVGLAAFALGDIALLVMFAKWDAKNFKKLQEVERRCFETASIAQSQAAAGCGDAQMWTTCGRPASDRDLNPLHAKRHP